MAMTTATFQRWLPYVPIFLKHDFDIFFSKEVFHVDKTTGVERKIAVSKVPNKAAENRGNKRRYIIGVPNKAAENILF
jgi:hypothetical protein